MVRGEACGRLRLGEASSSNGAASHALIIVALTCVPVVRVVTIASLVVGHTLIA